MENLLQGLNVFLIGMMGSGKTTVGRAIAHQLQYRFFDTDDLIQRVTNKSINDIFAEDGEVTFRALESKVLTELAACTKSVIATGGGIVLDKLNWSHLQQGLVVWLDAPVELLAQRLAEDNTRPLLKEADLTSKLTSLLEQRQHLYAQADIRMRIDATHTPEEIATEIIHKIPTVLKQKTVPPSNN